MRAHQVLAGQVESPRRLPGQSPLRSKSLRWALAIPGLMMLMACGGLPVGPSVDSIAQDPTLNAWVGQATILIDEHRATLGCAPLRWHAPGATVAEAYARQMSDQAFFGHVDPKGITLKQRLNKAGIMGYRLAAETIAAGQDNPQKVVADWIASPDHRKIVEDCTYTQVGLGFHEGSGPFREYWTALFFATS